MNIRYKVIEHERTEDAPFVGALISAIGCSLKCRGCFNKGLKKEQTIEKDVKDVIDEILSNPFNDGIIFGGLEWSEQPLELINLIEEASKVGLKIMIYTGHTLTDFQSIIGKACATKVGFDHMLANKMLMENDNTLYAMMGAMILDYYIPDDYYIKAGKYDRDKKVLDGEQFGVFLSSSNQTIYKIRKSEEQENEGKAYCLEC